MAILKTILKKVLKTVMTVTRMYSIAVLYSQKYLKPLMISSRTVDQKKQILLIPVTQAQLNQYRWLTLWSIYAVRDDSCIDNRWLWRIVYGLDNRQQIVWQLAQRQMKETDSVYSGSDDLFRGLRLEALIRYADISVSQPMFDTLPAGASLPSKSNSVDLKAYLTDLKRRYEKGQR